MRLFDTHCHLDFDLYTPEFDAHIESANQVGVERFLIPSIGSSNWQRVAALAERYSGIYYALGMHPYFLHSDSHLDQTHLEPLLSERPEKCVAVGECGLDAMVEVDHHIQQQIFSDQIDLAKAHQLPMILHGRKTYNQLLRLLKQQRFSYGGVLHGFSGSYQQAMQFIDMGFYIGIGGVISYPRANKTRRAVANLPLEALVLETDSPDMPLHSYQGQPNHPKRLPLVLKCLADLQQISQQTIAKKVWDNSHLAFHIAQ